MRQSARNCAALGRVCPFSHLLMAAGWSGCPNSASRAATAGWVSPASRRRAVNVSPREFLTLIISLHDSIYHKLRGGKAYFSPESSSSRYFSSADTRPTAESEARRKSSVRCARERTSASVTAS